MSELAKVRSKKVTIMLSDGIEREVRFTLNSLAEMEDKYGSVDAAFKVLEAGSIKAVRFMLWVGLMHKDNLTELQVGELIDMYSLKEITETLNVAMSEDMPSGQEVAASPNP